MAQIFKPYIIIAHGKIVGDAGTMVAAEKVAKDHLENEVIDPCNDPNAVGIYKLQSKLETLVSIDVQKFGPTVKNG